MEFNEGVTDYEDEDTCPELFGISLLQQIRELKHEVNEHRHKTSWNRKKIEEELENEKYEAKTGSERKPCERCRNGEGDGKKNELERNFLEDRHESGKPNSNRREHKGHRRKNKLHITQEQMDKIRELEMNRDTLAGGDGAKKVDSFEVLVGQLNDHFKEVIESL